MLVVVLEAESQELEEVPVAEVAGLPETCQKGDAEVEGVAGVHELSRAYVNRRSGRAMGCGMWDNAPPLLERLLNGRLVVFQWYCSEDGMTLHPNSIIIHCYIHTISNPIVQLQNLLVSLL